MANTYVITAPTAMTAPLPGTPKLRMPGDILPATTDTFSGAAADTLAGRSTDAARGGVALPWQTTSTGGIIVSSGAARASTPPKAISAVVDIPGTQTEIAVAANIVALPDTAAASVYLVARRTSLASPAMQLRLGFSRDSAMLAATVDGVNTPYTTTTTPAAAGDRWELREYKGNVQMVRNGAVVASRQFSERFAGTFAGLSTGSDAAGFALDNFAVSEIVH